MFRNFSARFFMLAAGCLFAASTFAATKTYTDVTVNYEQPLAAMISALHVDEVPQTINEKNFPLAKSGQQRVGAIVILVVAAPVGTEEYASYDMAMKMISGGDYRPATLPEMLALVKAHPEVLDGDPTPLVALGSQWKIRGTPHGTFVAMRSIKGFRMLNPVGSAVLGLHDRIRVAVVKK